jgi:hypothetical protein
MESTPRPTINPDSTENDLVLKIRKRELSRRITKPTEEDYRKAYRVVKKYREKQIQLLGDVYDEDPDPFVESYVFYCFTGTAD